MKNIVLASALSLGSVSKIATTFQTMFFHDGIMDIVFQEDFTPLEIDRLPIAVIEAIDKTYGEEKIINTYFNELKEYKIDLQLEHGLHTVYTDENGNWISK
ncbi:hypothetical protein FNB79_14420 [Formosa sediminum]|uniref:Uncharacterized protein n=1 Tax=Formosa sediminum TaxID=2594004 RepID=A0A516GUD1_9FLAO|nr:hypothetical protein [Formosa sediminum]QDO95116.1 hypothetical protein FNB79_14420 [Formosa sediminum]